MEERKSFVFFTSWAKVLRKYPPELRCQIYDALIEYAETGDAPELGEVAQMAFEFIKSEIDRTQDKYDRTCEKRRKAIQKRWEKSKNTKEYNSMNSIQKNQMDTIHTNDTEDEDKHEDEDNTKKINLHGGNNNAHAREAVLYDEADLIKEFFAPEKQASLEALAMQLSLPLDEMKRMAIEVVNDWALMGQRHPNYNDASRHLISTLRKKKQWAKSVAVTTCSEPGLGAGEFRDANGHRTYGMSGVIVPESAPPRPSVAHWWSEASRMWEKAI